MNPGHRVQFRLITPIAVKTYSRRSTSGPIRSSVLWTFLSWASVRRMDVCLGRTVMLSSPPTTISAGSGSRGRPKMLGQAFRTSASDCDRAALQKIFADWIVSATRARALLPVTTAVCAAVDTLGPTKPISKVSEETAAASTRSIPARYIAATSSVP